MIKPPIAQASPAQREWADAWAGFDADAEWRDFTVEASPINAAVLCCDRHAVGAAIALVSRSRDGTIERLTFAALQDQSERFARVLADCGVGAGDRVAGLLPRVPELIVTILAAWRLGAVYQPLFTAFGPKAIEHRVGTSGARVIVTDRANRPKLDEVPHAARIITLSESGAGADATPLPPGDLDFHAELARGEPGLPPVPRSPDDPFLIMFTSGTTGLAKPLLVPIRAILSMAHYVRDAVGLRAEDTFWNVADPGWAYGLYYAVVGPLALGHATMFHDASFNVPATVAAIREHGVTNLAGSPTAFRLIMAAGPEAVAPIKGQLRAVSSAGEPLNPEVIRWFAAHLDVVIHDHYGQTETGMVLCNHHAFAHPVLQGSAGVSMPGWRVTVIDEVGNDLPPGVPGELALNLAQSPLFWFSGYDGLATPALGTTHYRSGDTAELNPDGSISFVGRADDVITSAGYRIGPFDVESALLEHPAVIEAAVVGKPDPERTEIVKAFVVLREGEPGTPTLAEDLRLHVKARLSAHAYPREIEFVESLPKTPSGKIQRFVLRLAEAAKVREAAGG
jgi:acetyl-CoA synthetase